MELLELSVIILLIAGYLLHTQFVIDNVTNNKIKPDLKALGFQFISIEKSVNIKRSDFEVSNKLKINIGGNSQRIWYRYVLYKDKEGVQKKVAVKIEWSLFGTTKVNYRPNIKPLYSKVS